MKFVRLSTFCSIIIILTENVHAKPLPEWILKDSRRHYKEQTEEVMSSFIENMKKDFLWGLNLSGVPSQEKTRTDPPQFMIDLYNRFAEDKTSKPVSNIIRSFNAEDILLSSTLEEAIQSFILLFNVSIPDHEELTQAELKIHVSLSKKNAVYLLIYDVLHMEPYHKSFLESKKIERSGWVTIDVTKAVKRWLKSDFVKNRLEIFLDSNSPLNTCPTIQVSGVKVSSSNPPLLIVFSDDKWNRHKNTRMEIKEMIFHEQDIGMEMVSKNSTTELKNEKHLDERGKYLIRGKTRIKRSQGSNYCRRTSLIVNFKDIGWDSWIISPTEYEAYECKGECYYPLTDNLTPTKHAIIQALMHFKNPKTTRRACCVPTQLDPISLIYIDDNGVPTMKYKYEGMKVAKCGCR
ncbi:growth/differentiation factor 2 [Rhinophrynus dorsalis]